MQAELSRTAVCRGPGNTAMRSTLGSHDKELVGTEFAARRDFAKGSQQAAGTQPARYVERPPRRAPACCSSVAWLGRAWVAEEVPHI